MPSAVGSTAGWNRRTRPSRRPPRTWRTVSPMTDDLLRWTRIRAEVEWASVPRVTPHPGTGIDTFVTSPNLRKALVQARSDTGKPLTFALMATWQAQFA